MSANPCSGSRGIEHHPVADTKASRRRDPGYRVNISVNLTTSSLGDASQLLKINFTAPSFSHISADSPRFYPKLMRFAKIGVGIWMNPGRQFRRDIRAHPSFISSCLSAVLCSSVEMFRGPNINEMKIWTKIYFGKVNNDMWLAVGEGILKRGQSEI